MLHHWIIIISKVIVEEHQTCNKQIYAAAAAAVFKRPQISCRKQDVTQDCITITFRFVYTYIYKTLRSNDPSAGFQQYIYRTGSVRSTLDIDVKRTRTAGDDDPLFIIGYICIMWIGVYHLNWGDLWTRTSLMKSSKDVLQLNASLDPIKFKQHALLFRWRRYLRNATVLAVKDGLKVIRFNSLFCIKA